MAVIIPESFESEHEPTYIPHVLEDGLYWTWECSCGHSSPYGSMFDWETEEDHYRHVIEAYEEGHGRIR